MSQARLRGHVEARLSYLPLYGKSATAVHSWAGTAGAGLVLGPTRRLDIEAFHTLSPQGDDPYHRTPRIQMAGILIGFWGGPAARLKPVGSLGFGVIHVGPTFRAQCLPPICFESGGPPFGVATHPLLTGRFGLDARLHVPLTGDKGNSAANRADYGGGIRLVFRTDPSDAGRGPRVTGLAESGRDN